MKPYYIAAWCWAGFASIVMIVGACSDFKVKAYSAPKYHEVRFLYCYEGVKYISNNTTSFTLAVDRSGKPLWCEN